jgi:hypothetical protein
MLHTMHFDDLCVYSLPIRQIMPSSLLEPLLSSQAAGGL